MRIPVVIRSVFAMACIHVLADTRPGIFTKPRQEELREFRVQNNDPYIQ